jgi:hypothetical protein
MADIYSQLLVQTFLNPPYIHLGRPSGFGVGDPFADVDAVAFPLPDEEADDHLEQRAAQIGGRPLDASRRDGYARGCFKDRDG